MSLLKEILFENSNVHKFVVWTAGDDDDHTMIHVKNIPPDASQKEFESLLSKSLDKKQMNILHDIGELKVATTSEKEVSGKIPSMTKAKYLAARKADHERMTGKQSGSRADVGGEEDWDD